MNAKISILFISISILFALPAQAQRSYIRSAVKKNIQKDMEEKHLNKEKQKGKDELNKVLYQDNDNYVIPERKLEATLNVSTTMFKKNGEVDQVLKSKIILSPLGECFVMHEGTKEEMWILFDYKLKANYLIQVKGKTATRIPSINVQKMVNRMAKSSTVEENNGKWQKTDKTEQIAGYLCNKYVYTDKEGSKMEGWFTTDLKMKLNNGYMFTKNYTFSVAQPENKDLPQGIMIRNLVYDKKNGQPIMLTEFTSYSDRYDNMYFDLNPFKISDMTDGL